MLIGKSRSFQNITFVLFLLWFVLHSITFFFSTPIPILEQVPDLLFLCLIILAAFSAGSYALELMRLDEVSPVEDFVFATVCGLGLLGIGSIILAAMRLLNWWTVAIGLTIIIVGGFRRIIGLLTPPAYLFGPDEEGEDRITVLAWIQFILMALWIAVLFHFVLLPPVLSESLSMPLGETQQWVNNSGILVDEYVTPQTVSLTNALYALAMLMRGPHLAMLLSGLFSALALIAIYSLTKRYCGPTTGRSVLLITASVPIFSYLMLNPGDGMLLALFQLCSFYSMMRWFDEKKRRWALSAGLFLGYSLSVSITSVFFLVPMLVIAIIWAFSQQNIKRFVLHLVIAAGGTVLWLLPWMALHIFVYYDALHLLNPLLSVSMMSWQDALVSTAMLPMQLSFPSGALPLWRVVGPIFLIYVPFYFLIRRKNRMTSMAAAIGLVTVLIGRPFGVILDYRLVSVFLLSIPTAMATHRFTENGVKRTVMLSLLVILVCWYFYHATAVVEGEFDSPHRYILGIESQAEYLGHAIPYYKDAQRINDLVADGQRVLSLNHDQRLYFTSSITVARLGIRQGLLEIFLESPSSDNLVNELKNDGFSYLIINRKNRDQSESSQKAIDDLVVSLETRLVHYGKTLNLYRLD